MHRLIVAAVTGGSSTLICVVYQHKKNTHTHTDKAQTLDAPSPGSVTLLTSTLWFWMRTISVPMGRCATGRELSAPEHRHRPRQAQRERHTHTRHHTHTHTHTGPHRCRLADRLVHRVHDRQHPLPRLISRRPWQPVLQSFNTVRGMEVGEGRSAYPQISRKQPHPHPSSPLTNKNHIKTRSPPRSWPRGSSAVSSDTGAAISTRSRAQRPLCQRAAALARSAACKKVRSTPCLCV